MRWVQSALNDVLGLRLPLHGVADAATRRAIRSFQRREGLPIDGIVGPDTQRGLLAARGGTSVPEARPGPAAPTEPAPGVPAAEFNFDRGSFEQESGDFRRGTTMNKLLSFNPEPFESETEFSSALQMPDIRTDEFGERCGCPHPARRGSAAREGRSSTLEFDREIGSSARNLRQARRRSAPPVSQHPSPQPFDSQAFRQRAVLIANRELARWGNGRIKETDPRLHKTLQDYWKTGLGLSFSEQQLGDPAFQQANPWSAAFISWLMKGAGAGNAFKYDSFHSGYTRAAIDNRLANNSNPFKAYRIAEIAPQVGDLVCKSRAGSGATYDNVRRPMKTHCDIVTDVRPRNAVTVGGNVLNSVGQKILRTDVNGLIAEPNYFAVIRVDSQQPSIPTGPPPTPSPPAGGPAPRLLAHEATPPSTTLYVEIDLKIIDKAGITAPSVTGLFIPNGYQPGAAVDLVLYLHGYKAEAIKREAIGQYWNSRRFPYGAFREGVNASARNVVLVAPTLGSRSEAGSLVKPGGLDAYIGQVLSALRAYGPLSRAGVEPVLANLIFSCHSGGGWPMRLLAGGQDRVLSRLRECWGFDCTYNRGDDTFWAGWARARPNAKVYIYYISGSQTAPLAESLRNMRVPNAIVQTSRDRRHNYVPITHWQERLQGADFLAARSGGSPQPLPPGPGKYTPSSTRVKFERAALVGDWREALLNLNGLNMYEMLRALDGLSPDRRDALAGQRRVYHDLVNMPRIEYAFTVVETGQLPSSAPGDLAATGQVETAVEFLRERRSGRTTLAWGARVRPEFRRRVRKICAELGCDPNHLMAVMAFESGETFRPSIRNRLSGATGLIQFMPKTAQRLGTTTDALAAMTAEQQLDYVSLYFSPYRGRLGTLEDVYMAVLWPRAVGAPSDTVLFATPSKAYKQNRGLDLNGDGLVTKFEAAESVRMKLNKGLKSEYVG
jgi:hypothetical protein